MAQTMKDILSRHNLSILLKPTVQSAEAIWALSKLMLSRFLSAYYSSFSTHVNGSHMKDVVTITVEENQSKLNSIYGHVIVFQSHLKAKTRFISTQSLSSLTTGPLAFLRLNQFNFVRGKQEEMGRKAASSAEPHHCFESM